MNKYIATYLICASIASGHWFAKYFDANASSIGAGNPPAGLLVGLLWPVYASFVLFED